MALPPSPRLPQELVDTVIDYLYDDPSSLSACALVSHSWLPTSRLHQFHKISLKATSPLNGICIPQERCKRLHSILLASPAIIPCIRELEICEGSPLHPHYPDISSTTWVATERTLPSLFRLLTHVQKFDFSSTSNLFWKLLPPTFQNALFVILKRPTLTYVRLHSWIFPDFASLGLVMEKCPNLKGFALSSTAICGDGSMAAAAAAAAAAAERENAITTASAGATVVSGSESAVDGNRSLEEAAVNGEVVVVGDSDSTSVSTAATPIRTRLEVLTLDHVTFPHLQHWLESHLHENSLLDITSIRELRVANFNDDASVIEQLLLAVGPSLEHFHLKPGSWNVYPFNISLNTSLKSLRLTLDVPETAISWAISLISSFIHSNIPLASIALEFYTDPKKIDVSAWRELDALFVHPVLGESLKEVEIGLFAIPTGVDFGRVKEEMKGLRGREEEAGMRMRWYQLGIKRQRSNRQLAPRISRYEASS